MLEVGVNVEVDVLVVVTVTVLGVWVGPAVGANGRVSEAFALGSGGSVGVEVPVSREDGSGARLIARIPRQ